MLGFANIESIADTNILQKFLKNLSVGIKSASLDIPKVVNMEKNVDSFRKSVVFIVKM